MSVSNRLGLAFSAGLVVCFAVALPARATAIIDIYNDGTGNVFITSSGSVDLADLSFLAFSNQPDLVEANQATLISGTTGVYGIYDSVSGPHNWGSGGIVDGAGSGALFGVDGGFSDILVPKGYVSGTSITSVEVFFSNSVDGLGLTTGTYDYTWGTGGHADSLVVNISETAPGSSPPTPEPGTGLLAIAGTGAAIALRRTRH